MTGKKRFVLFAVLIILALFLYASWDTQPIRTWIQQLSPVSAQEHRQQAFEDLNEGDYVSALSKFNASLRKEPNDPIALSGMGAAYARLGKYQKAADSYKKSLEANPSSYDTYLLLGWALINIPSYEEAIAVYNKAIGISPSNPLAYDGVAEALMRLGRFDDALRKLNTSLALDPNSALTQATLGSYHYRRGEYEEALGHLRYSAREEDWYQNHYLLMSQFQMGDYQNMIETTQYLLRADDGNPRYLRFEAIAHFMQGDGDLARALFRLARDLAKARKDRSEQHLSYLGLGMLDLLLGNATHAEENINKALKLRKSGDAYLALFAIRSIQGDEEEGAFYLEEAGYLTFDIKTIMMLGRAAEKNSRPDVAKKIYERGMTLQPQNRALLSYSHGSTN